ncbi:hypothetical protein [Devosia faecipullorum]|uniref:hypothetical protein n=1 Tax=Devosia faecipullorum TaxID=2755039 RepID=UPI00187B2410|nr:hypothetical protein [Devosia faecipullorum]MBE7732977.1 hypothetical protein [Devosia faecipullorum]
MDQPEQQRLSDGAGITLIPEMRPLSDNARNLATPAKASRLSVFALILGAMGLIAGLSGLATAAWLHEAGQVEARRLASEIAQLRVSLDLYARGAGNNVPARAEGEALAELANRLAILERGQSIVPPAAAALAPDPAAPATAGNEDCLPSGMRILVAEGDSYPICGQSSIINVAQVTNGYIVLADGTTIASGGSIVLPGSPSCTIGVTSGGDEGLTGYAEIRVTC